MGHSEASLYSTASIGRPPRVGDVGMWTSCGVNSPCELFFDKVVSDARVFDRGRKSEEEAEETGCPLDKFDDDDRNAGCDGGRVGDDSELNDCERDDIATVTFFKFVSGPWAPEGAVEIELDAPETTSVGIGRPLTAATS